MLHKFLKEDHEITVAVPREGTFTRVLDEKKIPWQINPFRYRSIPVLMYQIWRGNYDLVYGNNFSNPAYIALIASKLLRNT
jgi:hypothetical protein